LVIVAFNLGFKASDPFEFCETQTGISFHKW